MGATHFSKRHFQKAKNTVYRFSGTATGRNRVAVIVNERIVNAVREYLHINFRLIEITLEATSYSSGNEVEELYFKIEEVLWRVAFHRNILYLYWVTSSSRSVIETTTNK